VRLDPARYHEIPGNPHAISAGCLLFATDTPIVAGGGTSQDFVVQQGGDADTFIFMLGVRRHDTLLGTVEILEGVFLSQDGPGFRATWDFHQLMREVEHGGWKVVPTDEVLESWVDTVEQRMNKG
jgi:hypothetical protein